MKTTEKQTELLAAMERGEQVIYMRYMGSLNPSAYYYRTDNGQRCTGTVNALLRIGAIRKVKEGPLGHEIELVK